MGFSHLIIYKIWVFINLSYIKYGFYRKECEELEADERNMESKIAKKQEELERTEKRLKSLENVRPQFMEEAEKLEKELQRYYDVYMEKHRNLDYLEHELDKYRRNEEERMEVREVDGCI